MTTFRIMAGLGLAATLAACSAAPSGPQTVDLGQVLDRTEFAITEYQGYLASNELEDLDEANMEEFTGFYTAVLNTQPGFYDQNLGVSLEDDGSFLGYKDANANAVQDGGEDDLFTVEIDAENQRLIATDMSGESTGLRFSGAGFVTGLLVGRMLNRQSRAGVSRTALANKTATPRSSYRAPASARSRVRSGGTRSGK